MPPVMPLRRSLAPLALLVLIVAAAWAAAPYARAASLVVRAASLGGPLESLAARAARRVVVHPPHAVPTRHGDVPAQLYVPHGRVRRAMLVVPGIHAMGIDEPRLTALAGDLAGSGLLVMTLALPDLVQYRVTAESSDIIEDAILWMAGRPDLATDGRIAIAGVSFAGGLALVAAGRPSIRDRVAYVLSFGGHGDLPRVMRYLATGDAPHVPGLQPRPPHDYGVAVILHAAADRVVPRDQVAALRDGIGTFLLASQLTLVDTEQADVMFARARTLEASLPEPAASYLRYVNDRDIDALGRVLAPHLALDADPAASPERAPAVPAAPVYLLHGDDDTVVPAAESVLLGRYLRGKGVDVRILLSGVITHAEVDRAATAADVWKLVSFWADILGQ